MTPAVQIVTTTASREEAQKIAQALVGRRLAACVQVSGPIESHFRWQGKTEVSEEWLCTIKTRRDLFDEVAVAIAGLHSYSTPEILATEVVDGSEAYLRWLESETEAS